MAIEADAAKTSLRETIFGCPLLYPYCLMPELAALVPKADWLVKSWLSCFADVVNPVLRTSVIAVKAKGSRRGCFLEVATTLFTSFYYYYSYLLPFTACKTSIEKDILAIRWWCRFVKRSIKKYYCCTLQQHNFHFMSYDPPTLEIAPIKYGPKNLTR